MKADFDKRLEDIIKRINNLKGEVVQINKQVNKRNSNIVKDIARQIEELVGNFDG